MLFVQMSPGGTSFIFILTTGSLGGEAGRHGGCGQCGHRPRAGGALHAQQVGGEGAHRAGRAATRPGAAS